MLRNIGENIGIVTKNKLTTGPITYNNIEKTIDDIIELNNIKDHQKINEKITEIANGINLKVDPLIQKMYDESIRITDTVLDEEILEKFKNKNEEISNYIKSVGSSLFNSRKEVMEEKIKEANNQLTEANKLKKSKNYISKQTEVDGIVLSATKNFESITELFNKNFREIKRGGKKRVTFRKKLKLSKKVLPKYI